VRCTRIQKNLSAYLAGELSERKRELVGKHLLTCNSCARELTALEKLNTRLDRLEDIVPSTGFEERFWRRVKEAKVPERGPWLTGIDWSFNLKLGLSTALLVSVVIGGYLFREISQDLNSRGEPDVSIDIAEIAKDMDFYRSYEIIREMDVLLKLEKDDTVPDNGQLKPNHTL
jgi:anti-sigma factor RsiW